MRELPILFTAPMVRAILAGRKTMTRRLLKPQPTMMNEAWYWRHPRYDNGDGVKYFHSRVITPSVRAIVARCSPHGIPGDRLWVRETYTMQERIMGLVKVPLYRADEEECRANQRADGSFPWRWTPGIHMRREHSRILLEVEKVDVEQVRSISDADAKAEGIDEEDYPPAPRDGLVFDYSAAFLELFFGINKRAPEDSNPFVWVTTFRVVDLPRGDSSR